ncbi:MAG TPA: helix-turn-helix domain-containing protein, partial [Gemmatimonadaceae bacterium]|nr:helix-turn-helix domain-containing protein [Gemmatimonadaceae bacterium]
DGDTEQRILDAANTVFLRAGTAGARMQDIAAEAGVNHALLHYYFRSKERLAEAVFRRAAMKLLPPVVALLASELPLEQKVARVVEHELDQLRATPHLPGYLLSELNHHPERAAQLLQTLAGLDPERVRPAVFAVLERQIDEGVKAGRLRPIAVEQFIANLVSLCIFPFAARPMLMTMLGWSDAEFARFIDRRRGELPVFFLEALRP